MEDCGVSGGCLEQERGPEGGRESARDFGAGSVLEPFYVKVFLWSGGDGGAGEGSARTADSLELGVRFADGFWLGFGFGMA